MSLIVCLWILELLVARNTLATTLMDLYKTETNPFLRHTEMFCSHLDTSAYPEKVEYASRLKKAGNACRKEYDARFDMLDKIVAFSDSFPAKSKRKDRVEEQMITELSSFNAQRLDTLDALVAQMMDSEHKLGLTLQLDPLALPLVAEAKNLIDARRDNFSPKMHMSLKHLLTNPTSIEYLKCFFRRRQMVEGLQFWLEVQKYRQLGDQPFLLEAGARFIYDLYVAEGGLRQVNLASEDADPIHTAMEQAAGINTRRGVVTGFDTGSNDSASIASAKAKTASLMSSAGSLNLSGLAGTAGVGAKTSKLNASSPASSKSTTPVSAPSVSKKRSKKSNNAVDPSGSSDAFESSSVTSDSALSSPITSPRSGSIPFSSKKSSTTSSPEATPRASAVSTPSRSILSPSSSAEPSPAAHLPGGSNTGGTSPSVNFAASTATGAHKNLSLPPHPSSQYTPTLFDTAARSIATLLEDNLDGFHTSTYYRTMVSHFRPLRSFQEFVADVGGVPGNKGGVLLNVSGRKSSPAPLGASTLAALLSPGHHASASIGGGGMVTSPSATAAAATSDAAATGRHHNHHEGDLYGSSEDGYELMTDTIDVYRTLSLPTLTITCLCPGPADVLGGCLDGSIIVLKLDKQGVELESAELIPPGIIEGRILNIFRHSPNEIFILSDRGKVILLDIIKKKVVLKITKGDPFATGLLRLDTNRIWISYGKTVQDWQWNTKKKKFVSMSTKELQRTISSLVRIENSVWVGDELGGVTRLNIATLQPLGERIRVSQSSPVQFIHRSEYTTRLKNFVSTTVRVWVGCRDGSLNIYDSDGNMVSKQDMSVHDLPIVGAANLDRHVVLGSEDGSLSIWKPDTLELEERVGKVHKDSISAICCNGDQKLVYSAGLDRLLATWQARAHPRRSSSKIMQIPHTAISLTKKAATRSTRAKTNQFVAESPESNLALHASPTATSPLNQVGLFGSHLESNSSSGDLSSEDAFVSAVGSGSFHLGDVSPLRDASSPMSTSPGSFHIGSLPTPSTMLHSTGTSPTFPVNGSRSYSLTVDSLLQLSKHPEDVHQILPNRGGNARNAINHLYLASATPSEAETDIDLPKTRIHRPRIASATEDYPSSTESGTRTNYLSARSNGSVASYSSLPDTPQ